MWQALNDLQLFDFGLIMVLVATIIISVELMFPRRKK